ncbi:hypothetical protein D1007_55740 [Hordeum vulgare]|nr:hypothetical protein D1007_55740 [Hordeum vulgare]
MAAKMLEKFKVMMAKQEEAVAKCNEMKAVKKMKGFDRFMEMKIRILSSRTHVAMKAKAGARKLLFVKPTDFDPNVKIFFQEYRAIMYRCLHERSVKTRPKIEVFDTGS